MLLVKTIIVYSFPLIALIGLITNSISFVIFSRKRFQNTMFSTYFRFYLAYETVNLILPINKMFELNLGLYFSTISNFFCKLRQFFGYSGYAVSIWFLMIISLDRFLSISFPNKFLFRKKNQFQILTSCFIIGFNYCLYIPIWFYYLDETKKNQTNQTITIYTCRSPGFWAELMNLFQGCLIPLSLVFLFTLLTIRSVFNSRKQSSIINSSTTVKSRDIKFAISSITINIIYLTISFPFYLLLLIKDYSIVFADLDNLYKMLNSISFFFLYIGLTLTFFINYFVNSMFRKEFETFLFGRN